MALGRRNSGMPYTSTPPAGVQGLKHGDLVAHLGQVARAGQAGGAGADDSDLVAVGLRASAGISVLFSRCQSATKRSRRPMPTGSPLMPRTHLLSHWLSCGHTRPQTAGSALVVVDDLRRRPREVALGDLVR